MTGRHLHAVNDHGVYHEPDDPGPVPGSVPVCPICGTGHVPDVIAVEAPPGYLCRRCGWWIPAEGGRVTEDRRKLWNEETRGG